MYFANLVDVDFCDALIPPVISSTKPEKKFIYPQEIRIREEVISGSSLVEIATSELALFACTSVVNL